MWEGFSFTRVVHLSHPISPQIPLWPGDPLVEFEPVAFLEREGYNLRRFGMGEHSGTHLNAPSSFYPDAESVDQLAAADLVLPLVVFDLRERAARDADTRLAVVDILAWEARYGSVPPGALACLLTGWGERWQNARAFFGYDEAGRMHYPAFSLEAARFLLEERSATGLGTDTHGLDPADDPDFQINRAVFHPDRGGRVALECLARLAELPPVGAVAVVGALLLESGTGSPAAVLALVP